MRHSSHQPDSEKYEPQYYQDTEGCTEKADADGDKPDLPFSGTRHRETREEREGIKAKSEPGKRRVPLTAIQLDPDVYPPSQRRKSSVRRELRLLLQGRRLPAIKVIEIAPKNGVTKKEYLLVEGYAIWRAYQRRASSYQRSKLSNPLSPVELQTIEVELVDAPIHKKKSQRLTERIRQFYQQSPGCPESRAAKELGCDLKTVRKYGGDLIDEWKKQRSKLVERMRSRGMSNRAIARALKEKWPCARGLSQPVINRVIRDRPSSQ